MHRGTLCDKRLKIIELKLGLHKSIINNPFSHTYNIKQNIGDGSDDGVVVAPLFL
jgi:hypothetical protein